MNQESVSRGICVIGRRSFNFGIGRVAAAALELLSPGATVTLYPSERTEVRRCGWINLPSGRPVPLTDDLEGFAIYLFTDVLWNGAYDLLYTALPSDGLKIAHIAFDSDELAPEWVRILNERFDAVLVMSPRLKQCVTDSGVTLPIGVLPLALDLDLDLARRVRRPLRGRIRFGTVSAFHERKNLECLVEAFALAFSPSDNCELVIHSNLAIGEVFESVSDLARSLPDGFVTVTSEDLSDDEKNRLINSIDVFVNISAGEGYSIGPREALAQGKVLVLSNIPAHGDLANLPGVFLVDPSSSGPARYPEIDNRVFGSQANIGVAEVSEMLERAKTYLLSEDGPDQARERRRRASEFSMTRLQADYRRLVDPGCISGRSCHEGSTFTHIPPSVTSLTREAAGPAGSRVGRKKLVVPAHDGGFFSLFNIFMSNLVWSLEEPGAPMVLPDWDVARLMERCGDTPLVSYCYSQPEDGNMWLRLFEPLYDLSADQMNDPEFLYGGSEQPRDPFNGDKEPLLTYTNAFDLYQAPWFHRFRRQYNAALQEHVQLRPGYQKEINSFRHSVEDRFLVSVHVKHPSHVIEQPGERIAGLAEYLTAVEHELSRRGINQTSDEWGVFVATDQERVVRGFEEAFGPRVVTFPDVTRVSAEVDAKFDQLCEDEKILDGHQLQHQLALDPSNWSSRWAWEVWRDAEAMAASNVLLHAVSNVATAVSYLNERVEMIYCAPNSIS